MAANQPSLLRVRRSLRSFPASNRSPGCRESSARTAADEICRRPTNSREATMEIPLAEGLRTAEAGARIAVCARIGTPATDTNSNPTETLNQRTGISPSTEENDGTDERFGRLVVCLDFNRRRQLRCASHASNTPEIPFAAS